LNGGEDKIYEDIGSINWQENDDNSEENEKYS
jgi:hypothetical protein